MSLPCKVAESRAYKPAPRSSAAFHRAVGDLVRGAVDIPKNASFLGSPLDSGRTPPRLPGVRCLHPNNRCLLSSRTTSVRLPDLFRATDLLRMPLKAALHILHAGTGIQYSRQENMRHNHVEDNAARDYTATRTPVSVHFSKSTRIAVRKPTHVVTSR